ncbi:S8 family serine peptidase [Chitinophaga polysaccharea]|uniref:S8 family serine peptidase n=1 Tax=Chitinophaga polysaccharea TaxID=1293035 RepID=UPI001455C505|nr:S8 family serine peptidase [Chitinophaga polysaccharea]NLR60694.1 S8 family serine peptidase [Chitinophaga polysaccharea]
MKTILKLCTVALLLLFNSEISAQKKFFNNKKEVTLSEDSTRVRVRFKDKAAFERFKIENPDQTFLYTPDSIQEFLATSAQDAQNLISRLENDSNVAYVSTAYTLGNQSFITTGEILLELNEGVKITELFTKISPSDDVDIIISPLYEDQVFMLRTKKKKVFEYANKIYNSGLVKYCQPNFYIPNLLKKETTDIKSRSPFDGFFKRFSTKSEGFRIYPNDPGYYNQRYYMDYIGNIDSVWEWRNTFSLKNMVIIDDGIDPHPDLNRLGGYTPTSPSSPTPGYPTLSSDYHGVAVGGVACAIGFNSTDCIGVAAGAGIYGVNIFTGLETLAHIADAFNWARQKNVPVVNCSWGFTQALNYDVVKAAVANCQTNGNYGKGTSIVAASGNDGAAVSEPASWTNVVTVGANTTYGTWLSFSNYGPSMDATSVSDYTAIQTLDRVGAAGAGAGNTTSQFGGTSAASPQVAAGILNLRSFDTTITESQARTLLQQSVVDRGTSGFDNQFGYGQFHAYRLLAKAIERKAEIIQSGVSVPNSWREFTMVTNEPWAPGSSPYQYNWSFDNPGAYIQYLYPGNTEIRLKKTAAGSLSGILTCKYGPVAGVWIVKTISVYFSELGLLVTTSPNPATNTISVTLDDETEPGTNPSASMKTATKGKRHQIKSVEIISSTTSLPVFKKAYNYETYRETLDVSKLRNDVYIIKVGNGEQSVSKQIIVNH